MTGPERIIAEIAALREQMETHDHLPDEHTIAVLEMRIVAQAELLERGLVDG